jgi:putative sterol carrier protein
VTGLNLSKMTEADIGRALALLEESLRADKRVVRELGGAKTTRVLFVARDTGRRITVEIGNGRLSCHLGDGAESDVMIEAAEETLAGVIRGDLDADAAYFSGRLQVQGSLVAAFKLRVKLLGLVQAHAARVRVPSAPVPVCRRSVMSGPAASLAGPTSSAADEIGGAGCSVEPIITPADSEQERPGNSDVSGDGPDRRR